MQRIKLDINPKGEIPVLNVAQYDKGRLFEVELVDGEQAFNVPLEYSVQLNVRKTDSKLVTAAPINIVDNIFTFATTEQMTACAGENIGSVTLKDADDYVITTLYFLISVQRDVLAGGIDSQSDISNLERQVNALVTASVEEIAPVVIDEIATPIIRRETVNRIESYGGTWVLSDIPEAGSYDIYFRHRLIASERYTAYKVFSTDPGVIVDNFTIPTSGVLKVTLSQPVNLAADYMLQIFKPFGS